MDASNQINLGLLIVTFIAAAISWRAVFAARTSAREANKIQAEMLKLELDREKRSRLYEQKAFFHIETEHDIRGEYIRLHLKNIGNGKAQGVEFFVNKKNITRWPSFKSAELRGKPMPMNPTIDVGETGIFAFSNDFEPLRPTFMFIKWADALERIHTQPIEL